MKQISLNAYETLRQGARVLEQDGHGEKVLQLADGSFLKLFRLKQLWSSALLKPYANRFVTNCAGLKQMGILCPEIIDVFRIQGGRRDAVHYWPLKGTTLRDLFRKGNLADTDRTLLIDFVQRLHEQGIYFRSLHLGNIVKTETGALGLIDVADLRFYSRPLFHWQRKRNMAHLMREPKEGAWLHQVAQP
jgi:hypothetical protein